MSDAVVGDDADESPERVSRFGPPLDRGEGGLQQLGDAGGTADDATYLVDRMVHIWRRGDKSHRPETDDPLLPVREAVDPALPCGSSRTDAARDARLAAMRLVQV